MVTGFESGLQFGEGTCHPVFEVMLLSVLSRASHFTPRWTGSEKSQMVNPRWRSVMLVVAGRERGRVRQRPPSPRANLKDSKSFSKTAVLSATSVSKVQEAQRQWGKI